MTKQIQQPSPTWTFQPDNVERWAWLDVFSPEECSKIIHYATSKFQLENATLANEAIDQNVRKSRVVFLHPDPETTWVYQRLTDAVLYMNNQHFHFDLHGFYESLQFTEYKAPDEHYNFHIDKAFGHIVRKLSLTVQLTDPSTYEGGDFEFNDHKPEILPREQGRVLFFPSYSLHRVTPVTSGTRNSLVAWVGGPPFK